MSAKSELSGAFVNNMVAYMDKLFKNTTYKLEDMPARIAAKFTMEYIKAIKGGANLLINNKINPINTAYVSSGEIITIQAPNARAAQSNLEAALTFATTDTTPGGAASKPVLELAFTTFPTLFWTGTMLEGIFKGRPPGHVGLVPGIMTTVPGICAPVTLPSANTVKSTPRTFYRQIGSKYGSHLSTLVFLCPAMIPAPPSPPYPLIINGIL